MINNRTVTDTLLKAYMEHLRDEEKSQATREKYERDIRTFMAFAGTQEVTKSLTIAYKERLKKDYKPTSVNSMLAALFTFFGFCGWVECKVKRVTIQRKVFCDEQQELTKAEYIRLLDASSDPGHERINLVLQTLCGTGIRVSELRYITVEAVKSGQATVNCKGKVREVIIPKALRKLLLHYFMKRGLKKGPVFVTRTGKPLDRSNTWREMKALCVKAHVDPKKVFPHNLRHLFARTYYAQYKDIAKLADILGHSNIETTRIYILSTGTDHARQVNRLGLVVKSAG